MTLSPATAAVLAAVQFNNADSIKTIAGRAGLAPHVVQYQLRRLLEVGVIRSGSVINHFALGLRQWQAYAALEPVKFSKRAALGAFLRKAPEVYWIGEVGGDYQYGMSVTVPAARALTDFFARLGARFGSPFGEKSLSEVLSYTMYRKKYLAPQLKSSDAITVSAPAAHIAVDKADLAILGLLSDSTLGSHPQIARRLGLPRSTFEYRLKALEAKGVIARHVYYINARRLGFLTYRIVIVLRGIPSEAGKLMRDFAARDPNIVFLVESLGHADYELVAEVARAEDITAVLERLHEACGGIIDRVRVMPVFDQSTSSSFLKFAA
jgi:DNA-binding Lrp family transcriptional regulator